jgi:hypothetical protein
MGSGVYRVPDRTGRRCLPMRARSRRLANALPRALDGSRRRGVHFAAFPKLLKKKETRAGLRGRFFAARSASRSTDDRNSVRSPLTVRGPQHQLRRQPQHAHAEGVVQTRGATPATETDPSDASFYRLCELGRAAFRASASSLDLLGPRPRADDHPPPSATVVVSDQRRHGDDVGRSLWGVPSRNVRVLCPARGRGKRSRPRLSAIRLSGPPRPPGPSPSWTVHRFELSVSNISETRPAAWSAAASRPRFSSGRTAAEPLSVAIHQIFRDV